MREFEVRGERSGSHVRVQVTGEVDLATAPRVTAWLGAHPAGAGGSVELDLAAVDFIDSTGVHLLVALAEDAGREGWTLTIVPSAAVRRVVGMLGLDEALLAPPPDVVAPA